MPLAQIIRGARGGQALRGILALLWQHSVEKGYALAIISGTTRQQKLYQHLGFVPFGPLVGADGAQFQPMYVTLETFEVTAREFLRSSPARSFHPSAVNFLPGPVMVRREVRRAFEQAPESHRGESFKNDFRQTKKILCELVHAKNAELFMGSGTLANDVIAAQLSLLGERGLTLSNGEFGGRLVEMGFDLVGSGEETSPAVITIALPPEMNSVKAGETMQEDGYLLSYYSDYLRRKNWIQVCLMGECSREKIVSLANVLNRVCFKQKADGNFILGVSQRMDDIAVLPRLPVGSQGRSATKIGSTI